jgi:dTDP-4-amino-4,6-dideoxygalactose transaminase
VSASTIALAEERIPFAVTEVSPEARERAARVLSSGWMTTGPEVAEFEREFAAWVGARFAVAVASCTSAIEISLRALDLEPGSRVLTSTMTFCGAVHAIVHAGLRPVLVDVNPETMMPDPETTEAAVRHAGGAEAMVAVHFAGYPAPVEEMALAAGLPLDRVIEDAAHAVGTWVGDRPVGTISAATCFSFYATKNLPIGEGGMITTDHEGLADVARRVRLHGMSRDAWRRYLPGSGWRYEVDVAGLKANMTDLQAAIGRGQLRELANWQHRREELARTYDGYLARLPGVLLPARPLSGRHAWHLYVIRVEPEFGMGRDELIAGLAEAGIDCSVHFIPLHHQPYFRRLLEIDSPTAFPNAEAVFPQIVSLPLYPNLKDAQVQRICEAIAERRAQRDAPVLVTASTGREAESGTTDHGLVPGNGTGGDTSTDDRDRGSHG